MSDENSIGLKTDPNDISNIERLIKAVDGLAGSLENLATGGKGMNDLQQMMIRMQATMVTGFMEMSTLAGKAGQDMVAERVKSNNALVAEEEKAWEKLFFTSQAALSKIEVSQEASDARRLAAQQVAQVKSIEAEMAAENTRALSLQAIIEKRDTWQAEERGRNLVEYTKFWEQVLAKQEAAVIAQTAIEQKRDVELNQINQKRLVDYVQFWEKELAAQEAAAAKSLALSAATAEKQRLLNTNFTTSPLSSQIGTAEKASVYSSLGGNATAQFGSAAATADLAALRAQYAAMPSATRAAVEGTLEHNAAMNEAHALARGLAGSLGGLWLTYGSLVPLAAGAALAASLKGVVTAGKEVEYQLKFVEALSGEAPSLDKFLGITEQTVVGIKDAAEGMRALAQNGLSATDSLKVLPDVLNLAVIGEMGVSAAALSATGVVAAFGLSLSDIGRAGDIFAQAAASSNTSVQGMTEAMKQASTVAAVYGVSIEEVAAAQGTLAKVNITGTAAGTAYTNILTNLYAPSVKATKALEELGVTTSNNDGSLKNSTLLLGQLRDALGKYNDAAQATFYKDIFSTRGAKGASTLLDNWDSYIDKVGQAKNATGFAGEAVAKLEDTVEGASRRLQNSFGATLVKAFEPVAPALQDLALQMAAIAGSDGAVKTLTNLAEAVLSGTQFILDHAAAIGYLITAYAAVATVTTIWGSVTAAMAAYSAGALVARTATAELAVTARLLTSSLGPIALAIGAATLAWEVFGSDTAPKVESADQKLRNSIQANIDYLERETKALGERNAARGVQAPGAAGDDTTRLVGSLQSQYDSKKSEYDAAAGSLSPPSNLSQLYSQLQSLEKQLNDARAKSFEQMTASANLAMGKQAEADANEKDNLVAQIQRLVDKGQVQKTIAGEAVAADAQGNAMSRQFATSQQTLLDGVKNGTITAKQGLIELTAAQRTYSSLLEGRAPKEDKKGDNDRLKAKLNEIQLAKELLAVQQKTSEMQDQADNKAGGLGDLGLLAAQNQAAKDKVQASIDAAKASISEVQGVENKRAAEQKYQNQLAVGAEQSKQLDLQLAISKDALFQKMSDQEVKYQAKTLADQGAYVAAYLMDYESNYGPTIKRVEQDITTTVGLENYTRLQDYLGYLNKMKAAGVTAAIGKSLTAGFDNGLAALQGHLADLANQSKGQAGLGAIFGNAQAAADDYEKSIGRIAAEQAALQSLADANPGDPKLQKDATAELGKMQALAEQIRSTWVSVGASIGASLTSAFGSGGTALGGLLQATIAYAAQKSRIAEAADKADKNDPVAQLQAQQKAAKDSTSAQISYYGNLASAAKGYFKEGSAGYQALGAVSKALQVAELAEAVRMFVVKSSMLTGLLGIQVASQAEAAAAEGAYTLSSIAMAGARAAASGVAAAVSAMVGWPFPLNFIALGATIAAVAALGVKITGGGGGSPATSVQRQATVGTGLNPDGTPNGGGILGDPSAKSDSIAKSLEAIEKDSGLGLAHTISMDNSLKQLVSGIAGLSSLLVQGTNLTSKTAPNTNGMAQNFVNSQVGTLILGGPLGSLINKLTGGLASSIIGKIAGAIFGGATSVQDTGLTLGKGSLGSTLNSGVNASQYTDTKTEGGWFSSDKYRTQLQGLSADINNQFTLVIKSLSDTVTAGAAALGLGGDAFTAHLKTFVIDIGNISTKGLTGDQIQSALQTALSKLGDDMAKFGVDGLQQFAQVGEGYLQTLTRVANDYIQVGDVLNVLGKNFNVTGLAAVQLSESLILSAGGIDKLTANTGFFVENFLTDAEKMKPVSDSLTAAFQQLNVAMPTSAAGFKDLVLQQDLNTLAGQQMYAALINIAPQFKTLSDYLDSLSGVVVKSSADIRSERDDLQSQLDKLTLTPDQAHAKERATVAPENLDLYDKVWALNDAAKQLNDTLDLQSQIYAITGDAAGAAAVLEKQHQLALVGLSAATAELTKQLWAAQAVSAIRNDLKTAYDTESKAMQSAIDKTQTFIDTLNKYKNSLVLSDASPLTPQQKYLEAKSQFEATLQAAMGGDTTAQSNFTQVSDAFLAASKAANASSNQYSQDFQEVRDAAEKTSAWAQAQLDVGKSSLEALNKQVAGLIDLNTTAKTVSQLVAQLVAAGGDTGGVVSGNATSAIETLYKSILGRQSDAGGLDFWTSKLKSGVSISDIAQAMLNSPEYQGAHRPASAPSQRVVMGGNIAASNSPDPVADRLDALIKLTSDQADQIRQLRADQKTMMAAQVQADYQTAMAAAKVGADATAASATKIVNSTQTKVAPK